MSDSNWVKKRFYEQLSDTDATVTTDSLQGSQIPLLNSAVITNIVAWDATTNITSIEIYQRDDDGTEYLVHRGVPSAIGETVEWVGKIVLEAYDRIKIVFNGTVAGDDIYAHILGYIIPQFKSQTERI